MLEALDAEAVLRWYQWGLAALDSSRDEINSLNVFPVPDADTGTNLHLTLESAVKPSDDEQPVPIAVDDLAGTATEMARLSLLGARGSSGVILSQLLRGVAEVLASERLPPRGVGLSRALERAVALAYGAVSHPVEGTMLTVARAAAEAARATRSDDLHIVVGAAVAAARDALAQTPEQLEVLGRAGVVDAGGRGVVVLLDALQAVVDERPFEPAQSSIAHPNLDAVDFDAGSAQVYEVMYLIDADDAGIGRLRRSLDEIGDSVVVSGGDGLWNVHVHTGDAGAAVDLGSSVGHPHRIRVSAVDLRLDEPQEQGGHRHDGRQPHAAVAVLAEGSPMLVLSRVLSATAVHVVEASTSPVADGARRLTADLAGLRMAQVVALVEPACHDVVQVAVETLAAKGIRLSPIAVRSPAQLLAAVAVNDPHREFSDVVVGMTAASAATRHAAVTPHTGGYLAVADGIDPVVGADPVELALDVLHRIVTPDLELVTVISSPALAGRVADRLRARYPALEVTTVDLDSVAQIWLGVE
ncbi:MAG: DAK2 domain-containing protein [Acidothermaceae bacterium]